MTCVVGVIGDDAVYLGADSAVSEGYQVQTLIDKKVFQKGPYGIGFAGSLRVGQLIKYRMRTPTLEKKKATKDPVRTLAINFVDAMRKCLKDGGAARETDHKEEEQENSFIVTYQNRLFIIDEAYAVCEVHGSYTSIGSGTEYALGSLYSTENSGMNPEERVKMALKAAEAFCGTVQGPFDIIKIPLA